MAEFADLAWGTAEVRRHLDNVIETAAESLSPTVVLETFKGLIHARPDVGNSKSEIWFDPVCLCSETVLSLTSSCMPVTSKMFVVVKGELIMNELL